MKVLGFWNNKGGTGKTSLAFQAICAFAVHDPKRRILVFDVCPQANLSELFLGGQENEGGKNLLSLHGDTFRRSLGGYFQDRLPKPYDSGSIDPIGFISTPSQFNSKIPDNIRLLAGDPLLELQSNAISTLANTQIPGTDSWSKVASWLRDFVDACDNNFDYCFVDMNPSFSMYTQIALAACHRLVLPVTADDSSRRGIQNALSLIYGMKLPSEIYAKHNFHTRMKSAGIPSPKIHLVAKNRLTQYVRTAKGYAAVLDGIQSDLKAVHKTNPEYFTFKRIEDGMFEIRDFQTAGVVAFARGTPFSTMKSGTLSVATQRVQVNRDQLEVNQDIIDTLAKKLW
ncbi:MAG: ParA family protein [Hyphomicrobium sp.]|uniref:ParA family protein n=1 Tax=Hyphomicrobium sp. TaxID=82 RepID=UPI00132A6467|nr:ParA family protein [Hyphomicrobium sp.]KAB2940262.1 MAG: ParA family protein [Hyphomicrobium sp.]MBZ0211078.1 ParA family protein [Hyphomicrobium sp.]